MGLREGITQTDYVDDSTAFEFPFTIDIFYLLLSGQIV